MTTHHLPAVALESTVISHGLPYPHNLNLAQEMEEIVRQGGAEPRTIAILRGELVAGLSYAQLHHLATAENVRKVSRRDLPVVVARQLDGATTVATTMWVAHRFGIQVFATGGIGGVHRGSNGAPSSDISADLQELAQTPVIVVCAGAKAILDLPGTLEYLETFGVTVVGYGTDEFPAFYSRSSGLPVDVRCDSAAEVVALWHAKQKLGLARGAVSHRARTCCRRDSGSRDRAHDPAGSGRGREAGVAVGRSHPVSAYPHRPSSAANAACVPTLRCSRTMPVSPRRLRWHCASLSLRKFPSARHSPRLSRERGGVQGARLAPRGTHLVR